MYMKMPKEEQDTLEEEQGGWTFLLESKTDYKAIVIKIMWYCTKMNR